MVYTNISCHEAVLTDGAFQCLIETNLALMALLGAGCSSLRPKDRQFSRWAKAHSIN